MVPYSSIVTLPIGDALRLDVDRMVEGTRFSVTSYTYDDGSTVFELSCYGLERPADVWLPIADAIDVLSTDWAHRAFSAGRQCSSGR